MNKTSPYYPKEIILNFVPYDLTKRLQALGFNERTFGFWSIRYDDTYNNKKAEMPFLWISYDSQVETATLRHVEIDTTAPLWQQACSWIYEKSSRTILPQYSPAYTYEFMCSEIENAILRLERLFNGD